MPEQDCISNCFRPPKKDEIEAERAQAREGEKYWKDGPFVKIDGTSTEASRNEPKAVEK